MWLKQAYQTVRKVLGKVRSGIETGARIFNKGKALYGGAKAIASSLPVIGTVANEFINRNETQANEYAKRNLGVNFGDLNRAVSTAESVSKFLPRG
jgi:hypothetical protein